MLRVRVWLGTLTNHLWSFLFHLNLFYVRSKSGRKASLNSNSLAECLGRPKKSQSEEANNGGGILPQDLSNQGRCFFPKNF